MAYIITSTIISEESMREEIRRNAALAVYAELVKYYTANDEKETTKCTGK